jgi:hypothetical protein
MTQQNAALVEQSTAAATSLRDEAQRLSEVVSVFNVGALAVHRPAAPARRRQRPPVPRWLRHLRGAKSALPGATVAKAPAAPAPQRIAAAPAPARSATPRTTVGDF